MFLSAKNFILALPICQITLKASKPSIISQNSKTLGDHIRKIGLELNLFQKDVARLIGVEETTVFNWENNYSNPQIKYILNIVDFLRYIPNIFPQKTIGEKLIYYRKVFGLSQKKMAQQLGIDPGTLRRWEKNLGRHKSEVLEFLSNKHLL